MKGINLNEQINSAKGFTLIELMIVVAIIGILAAIALPAYQNYTNKAKFTAWVNASAAAKTAVESCFQVHLDLTDCDTAGTNGIPQAVTAAAGVPGVAVGTNGVINVTAPSNASGVLTSATYALTPTAVLSGTTPTGVLTWAGVCAPTDVC